MASASLLACAEGDVGDALVVGAVGPEVVAVLVGDESALLLPQAETAANNRMPVADEINPRRFVMCSSCFLVPFGSRQTSRPAAVRTSSGLSLSLFLHSSTTDSSVLQR